MSCPLCPMTIGRGKSRPYLFSRYCPVISYRDQYSAQIIRPCKLEAGHFSFLILKGHRHKRGIIPFSPAWRSIKSLCLVKVTLRRSFQQSAIRSVTVTSTFRSLSIPESQFSQTKRHKGCSGLSYFGIDEILVSHLTQTEKCRKVTLIRQSHH
jgi:hypothetical protein